ncbi:MAG: dihydroxyacetone kinase subunit L [Eubacteriaceae bacterium]|jgi:dihydroxyacetone kinase-like protein|nr:dihydroxyacetone kinase subunit L [Eubacteriaceae bacterium]
MAAKEKVLKFIDIFGDKMQEHRQALTDMDQAIGDGDHGINMSRGMKAVAEKREELAQKNISDLLKDVGMTLVSKVGGASGPLYGTAFLKASMVVKGKEELNAQDLSDMLKALEDGVVTRGKATTGEKTILDSLVPAIEAYDRALAAQKPIKEAMQEAEKAAFEGVEYTKTIIATKGRASYLGERSIGFQDPGATSMAYLIQSIQEAL